MRRIAPTPPSGLSAAARAVWRQVHAAWSMDAAGRSILLVILQAADRKAAACKVIAKHGLMRGARAHPLLAVIRDADNVMLKGWRQLGLEPPAPIGRPPGQGPA
jgi:phage terminase small subunit